MFVYELEINVARVRSFMVQDSLISSVYHFSHMHKSPFENSREFFPWNSYFLSNMASVSQVLLILPWHEIKIPQTFFIIVINNLDTRSIVKCDIANHFFETVFSNGHLPQIYPKRQSAFRRWNLSTAFYSSYKLLFDFKKKLVFA